MLDGSRVSQKVQDNGDSLQRPPYSLQTPRMLLQADPKLHPETQLQTPTNVAPKQLVHPSVTTEDLWRSNSLTS